MKKKTILIISLTIVAALLIAGITAGVLLTRGERGGDNGNGAPVDQAGNGGDLGDGKEEDGDNKEDGNVVPEPVESVFAVWWWDNRLDESYLDFAAAQGVNEIYYYASSFPARISDFIRSASAKGIKIYWLAGKYEWIEDYASLKEKLRSFLEFQTSSEYKFEGVHFDIEPHQHPEFDARRIELVTEFVELTFAMKRDYPDIRFAYDIPCWLDDEITLNGVTRPAYEFIIDNADRVTLMSYRDSCEGVLKFAEDEINYALSAGKVLNLGVETGEEEDIVTFYEEGAEYMKEQLDLLRETMPAGFGIAVHHIRSWRELTERTG